MIYKSLMDIADNFDTFFFDAWGVFNINGHVSRAAIDVMRELVAMGKSVSIISNTPQLSDKTVRDYEKLGLVRGVYYNEMFTSGQLCHDAAISGTLPVSGDKYYVAWNAPIGLAGGFDVLYNTGLVRVDDISNADFVYCDFPSVNGDLFADDALMAPELSKIIDSKLPVICPNPDMRCFYKNEFCLTAGTPCKCFNDAGMKVFYYGKPFPEIFNTALKSLGNANPARTVMVGDTLETDILGANRAGIGSCLTLAHGITARNLAVAGYELTVDNIMRAAAEISAHPDFIIEKLPAGEL